MDIYEIDNSVSVKIVGEAECISAPRDGRKGAADQRERRREMPEVRIHDDRNAVFFEAAEDSRVLVEPEERFVIVQGAPNQKAADAREPAAVLELPEGTLHIKDIEVAGLEKPEQGFVRIALKERFRTVIRSAGETAQHIETAAEQAAAECERRLCLLHVAVRIRTKAAEFGLAVQIVGEQRVLFVAERGVLPAGIVFKCRAFACE